MSITMMQLAEMIKPELFVLIPVIWYIGTLLKKSEKLDNWAIPFVLLIVSVSLTVGWFMVNGTDIVKAAWIGLVQGILIAMVADYGFNLTKTVVNKK